MPFVAVPNFRNFPPAPAFRTLSGVAHDLLSRRYMFALLVFTVSTAFSSVASSAPIAGDIDGNRYVDAVDVQLVINIALGIDSVSPGADVDANTRVNAIDVQLVILAVLGLSIDTDRDGLLDIAEVNIGTDPHRTDTDNDGLGDGEEMIEYRTHPLRADTDGDGVSDGQEVINGDNPLVPPEYIIINEIVAANENGLEDENGDLPDWIELYNSGGSALDLYGWALSDDPENPLKWTFPDITIDAGEYLVVFASGKDRKPVNGDNLHANFRLDRSGEYLALINADGVLQPSSVFVPEFPEQRTDYSYGRHTVESGFWYFSLPSPGAANVTGTAYEGIVCDTRFSIDRGFYGSPFQLALSVDTTGAVIRYTHDGSEPTSSSGTVYNDPIDIEGTAVIRASAHKTGWLSTNVDTHTYIFADDVRTQSPDGQSPGPGWPEPGWTEPSPYTGLGHIIDYGMDPDIVNHHLYAGHMTEALLSVPTMSLVTDLDNLFGNETGIYVNPREPGRDWERPVSVELINPDRSEGFQIDAGMRIRGGHSRNESNPKHSFHLFFREQYGNGRLEFPLFGDEGVEEYDKIDLRTSQNSSWAFYGSGGNTMCRDVFSRDTQRDMGQPYTRSRYYHLYINGQYWGLFQTQERSDAEYAESYYGGDEHDYDVVKVEATTHEIVATDGNLDAYRRLWEATSAGFSDNESYYAVQGMDANGAPYGDYEKLLDVDNLIDYMIATYYVSDYDSPMNYLYIPANYYAVYNRRDPDGFKFFKHDAELSLLSVHNDKTGPFAHPNMYMFEYFTPLWLHQELTAHPDYRTRFADRVYRSFFNDGALTPESASARLMARANEIEMAIIAESARWGNAKTSEPRTKHDDWLPAINYLRDNYFPYRTAIVLDQFKDRGWYPGVEVPVFLVNEAYQHGGRVSTGDILAMTVPNGAGTIHYALDGSDPRLPGGAISPGAIEYNEPIEVTETVRISARTLDDSIWSAMSETVFVAGDEQ